jgi:hypothetical protein
MPEVLAWLALGCPQVEHISPVMDLVYQILHGIENNT